MTILAIDQGTTGTLALLLHDNGETNVVKTIQHQQFYPQEKWVEHDPKELIANLKSCITAALEATNHITAIAIANQGESCLAWHADTKEAISPVIVWQDNRSEKMIQQLQGQGAEALVLAKTGLPLDSYFSASKLAWIIKEIPQAKVLLQQGKLRLGTTDAFFIDCLSGYYVTDVSTASRTSLMNVHTGKWDEELCQLFGVPLHALPKITPTTGDFGYVQIQGVKIPIKASVVDQQAALYGHQCHKAGMAKITFGTGAFALINTGDTLISSSNQGLLPTIAWQQQEQKYTYALDGAVYAAGSALNWAQSLGLFKSFADINTFTKPNAIKRNLVFIPALSGLACPHWDRHAAGLWIGLSLDTKALDMVQSILEGIAFRTAEVITAMNTMVTIEKEISIDGGLASNDYFCQFLADILGRTIKVPALKELTALGAAMLTTKTQFNFTDHQTSAKIYLPNQNLQPWQHVFDKALQKSNLWYK